MRNQDSGDTADIKTNDPFSCGSCKGLWDDPVTIQCGHTYCRACLDTLSRKTCKLCGVVSKLEKIQALKTNILLAQTVENWFPQELLAVKLRAQGNDYFEQSDFAKAISLYSEGCSKAKNDHLLASNRSVAYACLERYTEALSDAESCISIRPEWPKGYFRKGTALAGLCRHEEACLAYLKCLSIDPSIAAARTELTRSIHKVLTPNFPEDLKHPEKQSLLHPNPLLLVQNYVASTDGTSSPSIMESPHGPSGTSSNIGSSLAFVNTNTPNTLADTPAERSESTRPIAKSSSEPCLAEYDKCQTTEPSALDECSHMKGCHSCDKLSRKRGNTVRLESYVSSPNSAVKRVPAGHVTECPGGACSHQHEQTALGSNDEPNADKSVICIRRPVAADQLNIAHFECSLCIRLLCDAVTTPCGHTFCRVCLDRSLDHTPTCPLCKSSLTEYLANRRSLVTEAITEILRTYFPQEYAVRKRIHEEEISEFNSGEEIPVFVCTMAYPRIPCPLHVFEPRYRLMIRQCMESGFRQFGMIINFEENEENYADYGTMLEIRDVEYFPDGRSVVDCIGGRRFKVKTRGHKHGYNTAKVEYLSDQHLTAEQLTETEKIHSDTHYMAVQWIASLPEATERQIVSHFGVIPVIEQDALTQHSGPAWHWWLLAVLPLEPRAQLAILAMASLKDRLSAIQRVLLYIGRQR